MKTIINKFTFIICFICFLTSQIISQTQSFLSFQENLNLPQDNLGVMPECIVEVNDTVDEIPVHKLYVYGMQGILIYNLNSNNWSFPGKIEFSEQPFGYYDRTLTFDLEKYPARQPMIYVPEEKGFGQLFAVGPDLRLWCINVANDQVVHTITSSHLSDYSLISSKFVFDAINSRIIWLLNAIKDNGKDYLNELLPVSLNNYTIGNPINPIGTISDFAINDDPTKNVMYIGLKVSDTQRYWVLLERNSFNPITSYPISFYPGLIQYVHTQDIHQVYCLPNCQNTLLAEIYIFHGDSPSHSHSTITSPASGYMCSAFNDGRNHLFLGAYTTIAQQDPYDVYIFQCQNNQSLTPLCSLKTKIYTTEKQNLPISIEPINDDINLVMKKHGIVKLNYSSNGSCEYTGQTLMKGYGNFFGNGDPTNDSRVFITSMEGAGFLEYQTNTNPWTLINHQTGQAVHSCFSNPNSGKSYYFSKNHTANSTIFIDEDFTLGPFANFSYPNPIGDCIFNPFLNQILISDFIGSPDAQLNAFTEHQGGLTSAGSTDINGTHNGEMFITNDGKLLLFSGGNNVTPEIDIRSALNYSQHLGEINLAGIFPGSDQLEVLFAGNPYQNYFVVSDVYDPEGGEPVQPSSLISYFYVLDPVNLTEIHSVPIDHDSPKFIEAMYTTTPNRSLPFYVYIAGSQSYISEVNIDNQTLEMSVYKLNLDGLLSSMKLVSYPDEDGFTSVLFLVTRPSQNNGMCTLYKYIPGQHESLESIAEFNSLISSMSFNFQTGLLYCYGKDENSFLVYQYDVMSQYDDESQTLRLKGLANEDSRSNFSYKSNEMIYDNENHHVFIPNGDHSTISRLGFAFDRIHVKDKIAWLSFPRLENQEYSAKTELEGIRPFPNYIYMENIPLPPDQANLLSISYVANNWPPSDLNSIHSKSGYKLSTDNQYTSYLPMLGSILDPSTQITINTGRENWVGYFPTRPQDPFDALAGVLDKLTLIKHHDWACVKVPCATMGPGQPEPTCWMCSTTTPLEYADMLILECSEDVTFQWGEEFSAENREIQQPGYYAYAEKPDYTPIFIELDTNDQPLEIGAFVADSCIGATVVTEGDSSIMLRGYLPDDTSGIITFEKYYGSEKKASDRISEYYVQNNATRVREKRAIDSREKSKFYQVSFRNENHGLLSTNPLILSLNPNPCQDYCTIEYFLPGESNVTFEVYDVYGRRINHKVIENEAAGNYSILWSNLVPGDSLPGIFIIRMSACGASINKKVIVSK
jgi:hypothetical protein